MYRPTTHQGRAAAFYVGKGSGSRVLQHVHAAIGSAEPSDKIELIREILDTELPVGHVIHRHGIEDEKTAMEVEAAVMECFPSAHNIARGRHFTEAAPASTSSSSAMLRRNSLLISRFF